MNTFYDLAIDSDGVLADFSKRVDAILGESRSEVPKGVMWKEIERYNRKVEPFFESLDLMDGARDLVEFAQSNFSRVFVLTATGYTPTNGAEQKIRWYERHFPGLEVIVVSKSPDKAAYATPSTILVDDRLHSIDPWTAAGGIGLLHTSVEDTIERLRAYL